MQNTANYKFKKPESTDLYNVQDFSDNMDAIDTALKALENGNANTLNGLTAEEFVSNENLLINADFKNPVNSSGKTSWSGVSTIIDGWKSANANASVTLTENGLVFTKTGESYYQFYQSFPINGFENKTVALSAKVNGIVSSITITFPDTLEGVLFDSPNNSVTCGYIDITKTASASELAVRYIMSSAIGTTATFEWIKLELGSVATPFIPPNKEVEKLKCGGFIAGALGSQCAYYPNSANKNCNDIEEFLALGTGVDGLNYPTANTFYYIFTLKYQDGAKKQIALEYGGNKMYTRYSKNGTWEGWSNSADGGNADKLGGKGASGYIQKLPYPVDLDILNNYKYTVCNYECVVEPSKAESMGLTKDWHHIKYFAHANADGFGRQEAKSFYSSETKVRISDGTGWKEWTNPFANYLPLTGGTLSGSLQVANGYSKFEGGNTYSLITTFNDVTNLGTRRNLVLRNSNHSGGNIKDCLQIHDYVDGVATPYHVLHSANMKNYVLPLDGSVPMSGNLTTKGNLLTIYDGLARLEGTADHLNIIQKQKLDDGTIDTKNMRWLSVYNAQNADLDNALRITDYVDGSHRYYKVLHQGNMKFHVLPLDGSVPMSGTILYNNNGKGSFWADYAQAVLRAHNAEKDENNLRGLAVLNSSYQSDVKKALKFRDKVNGVTTDYTVHHDGNSQKVVTSTSAPSDTSALWVVPKS